MWSRERGAGRSISGALDGGCSRSGVLWFIQHEDHLLGFYNHGVFGDEVAVAVECEGLIDGCLDR